MDKNSNKFKQFIKKDGFYVTIFVCLCIIAIAGAFALRNYKSKEISKKNDNVAVNYTNDEKNLEKKNDTSSKDEMDNAERVKNDKEASVPNTKSVSNTQKVNFINPIKDGALVRGFSTKPVYNETLSAWVVDKGVVIGAKVGAPVIAAADGKIVESGTGDGYLGNYIKIAHANGLYTVYSNLDSEGLAKKDKVVKANEQIGKIGNSASNYKFEKLGDFLGFQIVKYSEKNKSFEQQDPTKVIKIKASQAKK